MTKIPLTPTTDERLTKLEATITTLSMQYRALLNSTGMLSESIQSLSESVSDLVVASTAQRRRTDTLEATWKARMAEAVQLVMDWDAEPTFEDVWEIDQAGTDLNLTYRVEDVILP